MGTVAFNQKAFAKQAFAKLESDPDAKLEVSRAAGVGQGILEGGLNAPEVSLDEGLPAGIVSRELDRRIAEHTAKSRGEARGILAEALEQRGDRV